MAPQIEEGLIRVEDKIYSAEKLSKFHPGGPLFIKVSFFFIIEMTESNIISSEYLYLRCLPKICFFLLPNLFSSKY